MKLSKMIKNDYLTLICVILPITAWAISGISFAAAAFNITWLIENMQMDQPLIYTIVAAASTVIFVPIFFFRTMKIRNVFTAGVEVKGKITGVQFYKDRGRITYSYEYQGSSYQSANALHKTKDTKFFQENDEIVLILHPEKPGKAFIKALYA